MTLSFMSLSSPNCASVNVNADSSIALAVCSCWFISVLVFCATITDELQKAKTASVSFFCIVDYIKICYI